MSIIIAILVLGILVFVHEAGHFLAAKWMNVYVEKFSIGFGPKLYSKKYGETEYVLSALPLGGYVKMYGEQGDAEPGSETYDPSKEGRSYTDKNAWQKAIIIIAGPLFNILFGIIIFWGIYIAGVPSYSPVIGNVEAASPADKAGLKTGDKIVMVNGEKIKSWNEFSRYVDDNMNKSLNLELSDGRKIYLRVGSKKEKNIFGDDELVSYTGAELQIDAVVGSVVPNMPADKAGIKTGDKILAINDTPVKSWNESATIIRSSPEKNLTLKIERNGKEMVLNVTPKKSETGADNKKETAGLIGIGPKESDVVVRYGPVTALQLGLEHSYNLTKSIYIGLAKLVQREIPADSLGGPILIVQTAAQSADNGFITLLIFMAAISLNLAVFNLLPIPILDGGQLVIITAEGIMGRKIGEKALGAFQMFGLAVILLLMVFAFYNDIMRIVR